MLSLHFALALWLSSTLVASLTVYTSNFYGPGTFTPYFLIPPVSSSFRDISSETQNSISTTNLYLLPFSTFTSSTSSPPTTLYSPTTTSSSPTSTTSSPPTPTPPTSTTSSPPTPTLPTSTTSSPPTPTPPTSTTSSPPTPTPTDNLQISSDDGLSTGAKAGIGVGAVFGVIFILAVVCFILWRKRKQREAKIRSDAESRDAHSPERGPELMTPANTHEMEGKPAGKTQIAEVEGHNPEKGEIDAKHVSPIAHAAIATDWKAMTDPRELDAQHHSYIAPELSSAGVRTIGEENPSSELHTQSNVHEMSAATNIGPDWERLHPSELDSKANDSSVPARSMPSRKPVPSVSEPTSLQPQTEFLVESAPASTSVIPSMDPGIDELEALQKRIKQVREDKKRLERIQQLKDLETALQRDIMAEQKRRQGAPSGP